MQIEVLRFNIIENSRPERAAAAEVKITLQVKDGLTLFEEPDLNDEKRRKILEENIRKAVLNINLD